MLARVFVFVGTLSMVPASLLGQDCPLPPPDFYPADGSSNLPRNGVVRIVFHEPYELEGNVEDALRLTDEGGNRLPGVVRIVALGADTIVELVTPSPLAPQMQYGVTARRPFGAGETFFTFRTGLLERDDEPPVFDGAVGLRIVPAESVSCDVDPDVQVEDGFRVTVTFPPALDDVGPANMDYVLYQTKGPTLERPVERKRFRTFGPRVAFGAVFLPFEEIGRGESCFLVHAVDLFGEVAASDVEVCGDPEGPGYFQSLCATLPGRAYREGSWAVWILVPLALLRGRRAKTTR